MVRRRLLLALLTVSLFIVQHKVWNLARADQRTNIEDGKIAEFYKKLATANQTGLVFKFEPKDSYRVALYCTPISCNEDRLNGLFSTMDFAKFEFKVIENNNHTPSKNLEFDLVIEFIRPPDVERNLVELELRKNHVSNGTTFFQSEGEQKCRSLSALIPQKNLVRQVAVWLNDDLPRDQLNTCLLMQIARGSGLNTKLTFSDGWKIDGELSRFSPEQLFQFSTGLKNLLSIHFRKSVAPRMNLEELNKSIN